MPAALTLDTAAAHVTRELRATLGARIAGVLRQVVAEAAPIAAGIGIESLLAAHARELAEGLGVDARLVGAVRAAALEPLMGRMFVGWTWASAPTLEALAAELEAEAAARAEVAAALVAAAARGDYPAMLAAAEAIHGAPVDGFIF